jgi:NADH:ubiquinone oxidoreductase subunit K
MLNAVKLGFIMLNFVTVSFIMLNFVILRVVAPEDATGVALAYHAVPACTAFSISDK